MQTIQTPTPHQDEHLLIDIPSKDLNRLTYLTKESYLQQRRGEKSPFLSFNEILQRLIQHGQKFSTDLRLELALNAMGLFPLVVFYRYSSIYELYWNEKGFAISDWNIGRKLVKFNPQIPTDIFYQSIKIQLELETNEMLTSLNPSLVGNLNSVLGRLRITIKHPPLGKSIVVRRLPTNPITLETLIAEDQISASFAETIRMAVHERKNIVIAGEPGSGKTTLLNAILLQVSPKWRIIVLEDTSEIQINGPLVDKLTIPQIRYGSTDTSKKKTNIIAFSLRNSPDYFVFGEIQNKSDSRIVFEGLASGLRGLVTTHSKDLETLLIRWKLSHSLPVDLIRQIDLVVFTSRILDNNGKIQLKVTSIHQKEEIISKFSNLQSDFLFPTKMLYS